METDGDLDIEGEDNITFFEWGVISWKDLSVLVTDKHGNEQSVSVVYNEYLDQMCN